MTEDFKYLLSNMALCDNDGPVERTCPKCRKRHRESRRILPALIGTKLKEDFNSPRYREYYFHMCFVCIQTELLLPSED